MKCYAMCCGYSDKEIAEIKASGAITAAEKPAKAAAA